jgi:two-component system NtrC family sensor kinase
MTELADLNEALHELRRPLQALALASEREAASPRLVESSVRLATAALERLEREVNGQAGSLAGPRAEVRAQSLVEAAVGRWQARAGVAGSSLRLGWWAGEAIVVGDGVALSQALDNLIVNAIEHGGPAVTVEARRSGDRLRIIVGDTGRASRPESRRDTPTDVIARLSGGRRHGHGLAVVRRVAAAHGGSFALQRSDSGTLATFELPLANRGGELAA